MRCPHGRLFASLVLGLLATLPAIRMPSDVSWSPLIGRELLQPEHSHGDLSSKVQLRPVRSTSAPSLAHRPRASPSPVLDKDRSKGSSIGRKQRRPWSDFEKAFEIQGIRFRTGHFRDKFKVLRRLGKGGFGVVDKAQDEHGNIYAVKKVPLGKTMNDQELLEPLIIKLLHREANAARTSISIIDVKEAWLELESPQESPDSSARWEHSEEERHVGNLSSGRKESSEGGTNSSISRRLGMSSSADESVIFERMDNSQRSSQKSSNGTSAALDERAGPGSMIRQISPASTSTPSTQAALYLQMEYCAEGDLGNALRQQWNVSDIIQILEDTTSALVFMHTKGFLHNDVKPANILVKHVDGRVRGVLSDFGLAIRISWESRGNTPAYRCPRYMDGLPPCDIFALGLIVAGSLCPTKTAMEESHRISKLHGFAKKPVGASIDKDMRTQCPKVASLVEHMLSNVARLDGLTATRRWREACVEAIAKQAAK